MEIAKAEESLKAADLCYTQDLYNSSASRAYYAMFQGAQVALELQTTELTTSVRDRPFVPSTKRGDA